ncbi:hypothetical protein D9756_008823 [Leucocoprinus leucothites]|uniref:pyranose dehydrogenase (acceptor) n=1 Tax=Leucocoprinus leucothites TaxID=201217 RepID=A0A8H5CX64_9AGAR|nr:hypothetical protein D9756_008823 [Leucoagaricus leucothites]
MAPILSKFTALPLFFSLGICAVYEQLSDLTQTTFDFVIVGGGTSGAVLANRLSAQKDYQILVIEAGPSHKGVQDIQVPFLWRSLIASEYDWNFTTTVEPGLSGRSISYPRGHVLGGSSSTNAMFYTRGSKDDYDRWARITGDSGWSWDELLPYFKKNERWSPPAEPRNTTGQFDPSVHGFNGSTFTSLYSHVQDIDARVISAAAELGDGYEYNIDMNSGDSLGTTWYQGTIGDGERSSAATSYLTDDVLDRSNLHVVLHTIATRLVASNGSSPDVPAFKQVELTGNGGQSIVSASKEVILSAGAIGSPHILLNSGIGDSKDLESVGVNPIVDLPSVGKNLTDHPMWNVSFLANTLETTDNFTTNATLFAQALDQWTTDRKGPFTNSVTNNVLWFRLPDNSSAFEDVPDPSAGPTSPHYEFIIFNGGSTDEPRVSTALVVVSPASRGELKLGSSNPLDQPLITTGMFTTPIDMTVAIHAVRSARQFFSAQAWDGYVLGERGPTAGATTDEEIDAVIRENSISIWHPVSTAAMSAKDATYGVVDPDLKVKKVEGLRVVDASIMPIIISAHTQAPAYIIGERAADLILQEWAA